jgi:PPOX class probable F420-dependent enzyme
MTFPNDFLDLLTDETKALLYLATTMPDGSPQVSPVWFSTDGEHVLINTNEGRTKDRNMKARPQVAIVIQDPTNQDRYLGMRGEVVGFTREGANEHINELSLKYYGKPWTYREGQRRIIYRIKPLHFDLHYD